MGQRAAENDDRKRARRDERRGWRRGTEQASTRRTGERSTSSATFRAVAARCLLRVGQPPLVLSTRCAADPLVFCHVPLHHHVTLCDSGYLSSEIRGALREGTVAAGRRAKCACRQTTGLNKPVDVGDANPAVQRALEALQTATSTPQQPRVCPHGRPEHALAAYPSWQRRAKRPPLCTCTRAHVKRFAGA